MKRYLILGLLAIFFATPRFVAVANEITFFVNFRYPPSAPTDIRSRIEIFESETQNSLGSANETQRNRQVVCRVAPSSSTMTFLLKFKTTRPNQWVIDYTEPMQWSNAGGYVGEKLVVNKVDEFVKALSEIETRKVSDVQAMEKFIARAKRFLPDDPDAAGLRYYGEAHLRYARAERRLLEMQGFQRPIDIMRLPQQHPKSSPNICDLCLAAALSLSDMIY